MDTIEQQPQAIPAPRTTLDQLNQNIQHVEYVKHVSKSGQILRWAILTTTNGFAVTGRPSAAVSPANDDAVMGEKVAFDNARNELWPLMGYLLREQVYQATQLAVAPE